MEWSTTRSIRLSEVPEGGDLRVLDSVRSVSDAVDLLNDGREDCQSGVCIVYSASHEAHFVLFRADKQQETLSRFCHWEPGLAARSAATKAMVSEELCLSPLVVSLYRLAELCANVILPSLATWLADPWVVVVLFVVLWYCPAVARTRSFGKPLGYPLLNFVLDDFSFLNLHPHPRSPWCMYGLAMLRVCILLALVPLLLPDVSPLPDAIRTFFSAAALKHLEYFDRENTSTLDIVAKEIWKVVLMLGLAMTLLWLLMTVPMLLVEQRLCQPDGLADRIKSLAVEIEYVSSGLPPELCRHELEALQQRHPKLKMASFLNTFGPAWAVLVHLGMDLMNIATFAQGEDYARAGLLGFVVLVTICYANNLTTNGCLSLYGEAKLSWERGVWTDDYVAFLKADKGIQAIPSLIVTLSGVPFKARSFVGTLGGLGSICINVALLVPFITEQFDLGLETEGLEDALGLDDTVKWTEMPDSPSRAVASA